MLVEAKFAIRHQSVTRGVKPGWHDGLVAFAIDAAPGRVSQDQADREMVDGGSLEDLLASFERVGDDNRARGYQFLRMAALFRIDVRRRARCTAGHRRQGEGTRRRHRRAR